MEPQGIMVGTLNEDFAIESLAGDVFQLGNASYRILRVEAGKVRVEDASGQAPTIPFWLGEAPARTDELSTAVARLRSEVDESLPDVTPETLDRAMARLREAQPDRRCRRAAAGGIPGRGQGDAGPAADAGSDHRGALLR